MATCRACKRSHRDGSVVQEELSEFRTTKGLLSGSSLKVPAVRLSRLVCTCGWSIKVYQQGNELIGLPETEVWPGGGPPR